MPIKIYYPISTSSVNLTLNDSNKETKVLNLSGVSNLDNDSYFCIDMKTHLIEGVDSNLNKTGHLYNRFITSGDFFNIPVGINTISSTPAWYRVTFNYLYY